MTTLKGRLLYAGWLRPWTLITEDGAEIDLWTMFDAFFVLLRGKSVSTEQGRDSYALFADASTDDKIVYTGYWNSALYTTCLRRFVNIRAYLEIALISLSGRLVEIEIEEGERLRIAADPSEEVFGVYFTHHNSCAVSPDTAKTVCKAGQDDCCIFFLSGAQGFCCEKFNTSTALWLLNRLTQSTIRAKRIGNCANLGRKQVSPTA